MAESFSEKFFVINDELVKARQREFIRKSFNSLLPVALWLVRRLLLQWSNSSGVNVDLTFSCFKEPPVELKAAHFPQKFFVRLSRV